MLSGALAWGVATAAVAVGLFLFGASASSIARYRQAVIDADSIPEHLLAVRARIIPLETREWWDSHEKPPRDDFSALRLLMFADTLRRNRYGDLGRLIDHERFEFLQPALAEADSTLTDEVRSTRRLIGAVPIEQLRELDVYPAVASFVANYDAGVRDALRARSFI